MALRVHASPSPDREGDSINTRDAVGLIRGAIPGHGGTWVDLGSGDGTFTRALVELLGRDAPIYAVDRDAGAIAALERWARRAAAHVIPVVADFSGPFHLPGLERTEIDGMLFANALHFVPEVEAVLARLAAWLRPGGRVVIVEYDRRPSSRWVPYPIPVTRWAELAVAAGLSAPVVIARRPSAFGGDLYAAVADRPAARAAD